MPDNPPKQPHGIGWYAAWGVLALVMYVGSARQVTILVAGSGSDKLHGYSWFVYQPVYMFTEAMPDESALGQYREDWIMGLIGARRGRYTPGPPGRLQIP